MNNTKIKGIYIHQDTTLYYSEVIEYVFEWLFSVLHFVDGPCALLSQPAARKHL